MDRSFLICGAALLLAALTFCAAELPLDPLPLSDWTNGTSLFWGGPQDGQDELFTVRLPAGACGFGEMDPKMWPFFLVAGVSPRSPLVQRRPQASCGTCLEIKCTSSDPKVCTGAPSVTVVITDECPNCAADQLNLHAFAFEQIADLQSGSAAIQYRQVECSPTDNITVRVDGFRVVQGGWLRVSLKTVASDGGVVRVELARSANGRVGSNSTSTDGSIAAPAAPVAPDATAETLPKATQDAVNGSVWQDFTNTYGADWEISALPSPPYDLRLTDAYGRRIILTNVITKAGALGEFPGHGQFPGLENATIQAGPVQDGAPAAPTPTAAPSSPKAAPAATAAPTATATPEATAAPAATAAPTAATTVPTASSAPAATAAPKASPEPSPSPARKTVTLRTSLPRGVDRRLLQSRSLSTLVDEMPTTGTRGQKAGPMP